MSINISKAVVLSKHPMFRESVKNSLKRLNIQVLRMSGNANAVLADLAKNSDPVDLIITDVFLDDTDVHKLIKTAKGMEFFRTTQFIVTATADEIPEIISIFKYGLIGYLVKPFKDKEFEVFIQKTRKLLTVFDANIEMLHSYIYGKFSQKQNDHFQALSTFENILNKMNIGLINYELGKTHHYLNNQPKSMECFTVAIKQDPTLKDKIIAFAKMTKSAKKSVEKRAIPKKAILNFALNYNEIQSIYGIETVKSVIIAAKVLNDRSYIKSIVSTLGIKNITTTQNMSQIISAIETKPPNLIITTEELEDCKLMQFLQLCEDLRRNQHFIIFAILDQSPYDRLDELFSLGLDGYTLKPTTAANLKVGIHESLLFDDLVCNLDPKLRRMTKRGFVQMKLENIKKAQDLITSVISKTGDIPIPVLLKAMIYHEKLGIDAASSYYQAAVNALPDCSEAIEKIRKRISAKMSRKAIAVENASKAENSQQKQQNKTSNQEQTNTPAPNQRPSKQVPYTLTSETTLPPDTNKISYTMVSEKTVAKTSNEPAYKMIVENNTPPEIKENENKPNANNTSSPTQISPPPEKKPDKNSTPITGQTTLRLSDEINAWEITEAAKQQRIRKELNATNSEVGSKQKKQLTLAKDLGMTPIQTIKFNDVEQILTQSKKVVKQQDQGMIEIREAEVRKWYDPESLEKINLSKELIKPNTGKIITEDVTMEKWFDTFKPFTEELVKLTSQAQLFSSRQHNLQDADFNAPQSSYFENLGKVLTEQNIFDILQIEDPRLRKQIKKILKSINNNPAQLEEFQRIGKSLVEDGAVDKLYQDTAEFWSAQTSNNPPQLSEEQLYQMQQYSQAIVQMENLIKKVHSEFWDGKKSSEDILSYVLGQPEKIKDNFTLLYRAMEEDHRSIETFKKVYVIAQQSKSPDLQDKVFAFAKDAYLSNHRATNVLANFFMESGNYQHARDFYLQSLAADPHDLGALKNLAVIALKFSEFKDVEKYCNKMLRLDKRNEDAYNLIAVSYKKQNKFKKSVKQYRIGIKYNPNSRKLHFNLAIAYASLNEIEKSKRHKKRAEQIKREEEQDQLKLSA